MDLLEAAAKARHDLGKYVHFQARWLEGAGDDELRAALADDLLRTRRGPTGAASAVTLWSELRPALAPAGVDRIDALMADLADRAGRLDRLDGDELRRTAALAKDVADELKKLHARLAAGA